MNILININTVGKTKAEVEHYIDMALGNYSQFNANFAANFPNGLAVRSIKIVTSNEVKELDEMTSHEETPFKGKSAVNILEEAFALMKLKEEEYGSAYKKGGEILAAYFPDGVTLKTIDQFQRFLSFLMCTSKMNRYSFSLEAGGHKGSAIDLICYAGILTESTDD